MKIIVDKMPDWAGLCPYSEFHTNKIVNWYMCRKKKDLVCEIGHKCFECPVFTDLATIHKDELIAPPPPSENFH